MSAVPALTPIRKVLIANRGEIATRVALTCRQLGVSTVAVYSVPDRDSPHVTACTEAVCIGPAAALESYLNIDNVLDAAKRTGANAVHPGYGFLSENPEFARRCTEAGLIFIGPLPETMHKLGNKKAVKEMLQALASSGEARVPLIPGYNGQEQSVQAFLRHAQDIGYPVLLKAAAGGGGKGMRVVRSPEEMEASVASVKAEASSSFGDSVMLLEKYFESCRHIEVQILGDSHGNVTHLGERDCSVQRRYQKVLEETPSPFMTPQLRDAMGEAAVNIAKLTSYRGAGTVEFLVDEQRNFYFLEVNTRLQVEHPITELRHGIDLVALQLRVAEGHSLPQLVEMGQLPQYCLGGPQHTTAGIGHAIEARLYAEDPRRNFFPCTGRLLAFMPPRHSHNCTVSPAKTASGVRIDAGVSTGSVISVHYDPMLAKVIAYGPTRRDALRAMEAALSETAVLGLVTNQAFLLAVLRSDAFSTGLYDTRFIGQYFPAHRLERLGQVAASTLNEIAVVTAAWDWHRRTVYPHQPHAAWAAGKMAGVHRAPKLAHIPGGWSNSPRKPHTLAFTSGNEQLCVSYQHSLQPGQASMPPFVFTAQVSRPSAGASSQTLQVELSSCRDLVCTEMCDVRQTVVSEPQWCQVLSCAVDGVLRNYVVASRSSTDQSQLDVYVHAGHCGSHVLRRQSRFSTQDGSSQVQGTLIVKAPIPCKVLRVQVETGQTVKQKQLLLMVESMKMEMKVFAEQAGQVSLEKLCKPGQVVEEGTKLMTIVSKPKSAL